MTFEQGDLPAALVKTDQAFRESTNRNPVWNWKFRILKAEILLWENRSGDVLSVLAVPPPPELSGGEFAVREKAAEGMALAYLRRDRDAEAALKEGEKLAIIAAPQLRCELILFEGNYAHFKGQFAETDDARRAAYSLAEERYRLSLQLARRYQQPYFEQGGLIGLAITATSLGRFDEAIDWSTKSLSFARAHHFRLAENFAIANLAWGYGQLGDLEKASFTLSEELKVVDSLGQDQFKQMVLNNLGDVYLAQGNYTAAMDSCLKALTIAREQQRKGNSDEKSYILLALTHGGEAAIDHGDIEQAEQYAQQAETIDSTDPRTVVISATIIAAKRNFTRAKSRLQGILGAKGIEAFVRWDAEAELARILVAEHRNLEAKVQFQKLIDEIESVRSSLHVIENRLAFSSHANRVYDDYISFLVDIGQKEKAFQVAEFSRGRVLAEGVGLKAPSRPGDIRVGEVQRFLRLHKRIILAYWLTPKKSFLWVITPSHFELFQLAPGREIQQKVGDYNQALLGHNNADPQTVESEGQDLYQVLIAPGQKLIRGEAKLVIIPHGALTKLSFDTLRAAHPAPHYWIQDVELETASSSTLLVQGKHSPANVRRLLLIGDPAQASSDYPALTHAPEEMKRLEAHFSPAKETVVSGKQATPAAYESSHPERFGLIHFVTHGTASELSPMESAIVLSPQAGESFKLYARDIVNIPLHADLVTISACYGAGKRTYSSEGLVGLAWAFLRAGAHQVVAGLWEVDDRAAVDLMDDFYGELQKGKSASAALRLAKLKMVLSNSVYSHPYYWGSLQLYIGS